MFRCSLSVSRNTVLLVGCYHSQTVLIALEGLLKVQGACTLPGQFDISVQLQVFLGICDLLRFILFVWFRWQAKTVAEQHEHFAGGSSESKLRNSRGGLPHTTCQHYKVRQSVATLRCQFKPEVSLVIDSLVIETEQRYLVFRFKK